MNEQTKGGDTNNEAAHPSVFVSRCVEFRNELKIIAKNLKGFKEAMSKRTKTALNEDREEELANLTLTYRHLEDASMRIGKAIQAYEGGVSIYDKKIESESSAVGS